MINAIYLFWILCGIFIIAEIALFQTWLLASIAVIVWLFSRLEWKKS